MEVSRLWSLHHLFYSLYSSTSLLTKLSLSQTSFFCFSLLLLYLFCDSGCSERNEQPAVLCGV